MVAPRLAVVSKDSSSSLNVVIPVRDIGPGIGADRSHAVQIFAGRRRSSHHRCSDYQRRRVLRHAHHQWHLQRHAHRVAHSAAKKAATLSKTPASKQSGQRLLPQQAHRHSAGGAGRLVSLGASACSRSSAARHLGGHSFWPPGLLQRRVDTPQRWGRLGRGVLQQRQTHAEGDDEGKPEAEGEGVLRDARRYPMLPGRVRETTRHEMPVELGVIVSHKPGATRKQPRRWPATRHRRLRLQLQG